MSPRLRLSEKALIASCLSLVLAGGGVSAFASGDNSPAPAKAVSEIQKPMSSPSSVTRTAAPNKIPVAPAKPSPVATAPVVVKAQVAAAELPAAAEKLLATQGSRGPFVVGVQRRLGVVADGMYGLATARVVWAFQSQRGLAVTGSVNTTTWAVLSKVPVRAVVKPAPRPAAQGRSTPPKASSGASGPTGWAALNRAISQVGGGSSATWVVSKKYGAYGVADWYNNTIYVGPHTPEGRLFSVAVHEFAHLQQVRAYNGDVAAAQAAMNRRFGGSGNTGAERAADCMALLRGANWTNYTSCDNGDWKAAARALLNGQRI